MALSDKVGEEGGHRIRGASMLKFGARNLQHKLNPYGLGLTWTLK